MSPHQDLAAPAAGDPRHQNEVGRVATGRPADACPADGAAPVLDQLDDGRPTVTPAPEDPGRECLPLAPVLGEHGQLGPDRLADRQAVGENAGDEEAEPRLLLPDVPTVPDCPGIGIRQQGGKPVPAFDVIDHPANATDRESGRRVLPSPPARC
ncbi:hypothetical protein GCM10010254_40760 [Streptomyces chromofuscus]|nr:hypothetical protein GCM10010254_40760 [Streptomyces chromofuscus]